MYKQSDDRLHISTDQSRNDKSLITRLGNPACLSINLYMSLTPHFPLNIPLQRSVATAEVSGLVHPHTPPQQAPSPHTLPVPSPAGTLSAPSPAGTVPSHPPGSLPSRHRPLTPSRFPPQYLPSLSPPSMLLAVILSLENPTRIFFFS